MADEQARQSVTRQLADLRQQIELLRVSINEQHRRQARASKQQQQQQQGSGKKAKAATLEISRRVQSLSDQVLECEVQDAREGELLLFVCSSGTAAVVRDFTKVWPRQKTKS